MRLGNAKGEHPIHHFVVFRFSDGASQRSLVEIGDWETKIVIAPDQVAVPDGKLCECSRIEIHPNQRIVGLAQKWGEIHHSLLAVVEAQAKSVVPELQMNSGPALPAIESLNRGLLGFAQRCLAALGRQPKKARFTARHGG